MNAIIDSKASHDYVVADMALAGWGRKELNIAETEKDQPSSILSFSVNIVLQKGDDAK